MKEPSEYVEPKRALFPILRGRLLKHIDCRIVGVRTEFPILRGRLLKAVVTFSNKVSKKVSNP